MEVGILEIATWRWHLGDAISEMPSRMYDLKTNTIAILKLL